MGVTLVCDQNKNISNEQVTIAAKTVNANFFACVHWVQRVGTLGVALYRCQRHINFNLHFTELNIGSSIKYENT